MKLRSNRGAITIFVLVGLLFMSAFLMLSYANNVNKSKIAKEQFNMLSDIYSYNDGDENAYDRAYTDLRRQNTDVITKSSENISNLELTKTFEDNISDLKIYGNSVQDTTTNGNPSPTNPVEIQSVGDLVTDTEDSNYGKYKIPVKVSGKNLLNPNTVVNENLYIYSATGIEMTPSATGGTWRASDFIPITAGKIYHLNAINSNASAAGIAWYNSNKTYISGENTTTINANNGNITAPANACYIRVSWRIDEGYNPNWENTVQLEEGTEATEFQSYVEPQIVNIFLDEPLRKIGDKSDYIDFSTGKVVRKIKELVLDGTTETWTTMDGNAPYVLNTLDRENVWQGTLNIKSTHFETVDNSESWVNYSSMLSVSSLHPRYICFRYTNESSLEDFKDWLADNKVKVSYILETQTEKIVEIPELLTYEDYTNIQVLTEVAPSKIEATYYGYTVE